MNKPLVLLDVDGVLADYVTPVLRELSIRMGKNYTEADVTNWDIYEVLGIPENVGQAVDQGTICWPGFCAGLQPYPAAAEGVAALREIATVKIVTAPFDSDCWQREREKWLCSNFGFKRYDIHQTHSKDDVDGDFLIDDKALTIEKWQKVRRDRTRPQLQLPTGILFDRSWNRRSTFTGHRTNDWREIQSIVSGDYNRMPGATP